MLRPKTIDGAYSALWEKDEEMQFTSELTNYVQEKESNVFNSCFRKLKRK